MSANAMPISAAQFATALEALTTSSLIAKASEVRNSMFHLQKSNNELRDFSQRSDGGDLVCEEAILENLEVLRRLEERLCMILAEGKKRGSYQDAFQNQANHGLTSSPLLTSTTNGGRQNGFQHELKGPTASDVASQSTTISDSKRALPALTDSDLRRHIENLLAQDTEAAIDRGLQF